MSISEKWIWMRTPLSPQVGVKALPTLVVFEDGEEVARRTGATDEEGLRDWIESNAA